MKRLLLSGFLLLLAACSQVTPDPSPTELGPMSFGTSEYDAGLKLAKHSSRVYALGYTRGNLHATQKGDQDAFIRRLNGSSRGTIWTHLDRPVNE